MPGIVQAIENIANALTGINRLEVIDRSEAPGKIVVEAHRSSVEPVPQVPLPREKRVDRSKFMTGFRR